MILCISKNNCDRSILHKWNKYNKVLGTCSRKLIGHESEETVSTKRKKQSKVSVGLPFMLQPLTLLKAIIICMKSARLSPNPVCSGLPKHVILSVSEKKRQDTFVTEISAFAVISKKNS